MRKYIYYVTFKPYGSRDTEPLQRTNKAFLSRKSAEKEAYELRSCGHTKVTINRLG